MNLNEPASSLAVWREDEEILGHIGREFSKQNTYLTLRLPKLLAERALASWQRECETIHGEIEDGESPQDRNSRERSGTLALIGLCLENGYTVSSDGSFTVAVGAWQIGDALRAADELGFL